jgi:hypothetical protein
MNFLWIYLVTRLKKAFLPKHRIWEGPTKWSRDFTFHFPRQVKKIGDSCQGFAVFDTPPLLSKFSSGVKSLTIFRTSAVMSGVRFFPNLQRNFQISDSPQVSQKPRMGMHAGESWHLKKRQINTTAPLQFCSPSWCTSPQTLGVLQGKSHTAVCCSGNANTLQWDFFFAKTNWWGSFDAVERTAKRNFHSEIMNCCVAGRFRFANHFGLSGDLRRIEGKLFFSNSVTEAVAMVLKRKNFTADVTTKQTFWLWF